MTTALLPDVFYGGAARFFLRDIGLFYGPSAQTLDGDGRIITRISVSAPNEPGDIVSFEFIRQPGSSRAQAEMEAKMSIYFQRGGIEKFYSASAATIICGMLYEAFCGHVYKQALSFEEAKAQFL